MERTGHTVLVTGGATGIGFALAKTFHEAGNRVILVGRTGDALTAASSKLPGSDIEIADVSVAADRAKLAERHRGVSVLINNAGIQRNAPFIDLSPADIEEEAGIDFLAPVLMCRAFLPAMLKMPSAAIVNVSSGLALVPKQTAAVYCASKAALHSFTKTLRWQLQGTPVKVFEVLPPVVDTPMTAGRGRAKITPDRLAQEFWRDFGRDHYEMRIGLTKWFAFMHRLAPRFVEGLVRSGN